MKLIALAAAATLFGGVAIAQDQPAAQTAPAPEGRLGGLQPSTPALSGTPAPGQPVVFRANPQTPTQAFPPPAALENPPLCKKGQYDQCRQGTSRRRR